MFVEKTEKYEVVIGVQTDTAINSVIKRKIDLLIESWEKYAKEYYDKYGIYVSAIANKGRAIYNKEWGCPDGGERVVTFNCTRNPKFIKDKVAYMLGVTYITSLLKDEFKQHTITMTVMEDVTIKYITDEDNMYIEGIKSIKEVENDV